MWRKRLRFAIALFVVVFAAVVGIALRKGHKPAAAPVAAPKKLDEKAVVNNMGNGEYVLRDPLKGGQIKLRIKFGNQLTYADGSSKFGNGVRIELPDRNGRQVVLEGQEARITIPPGKQVGTVDIGGGTKLTTSDGIVVNTASASYNDDEQMTRIPGPLTFKKGRMTGSGVGGTYDQTRGVLWLLDQARVDVAPDKKNNGAIHVTSKAAGMARLEHYMKFTEHARLDGEGHVTEADEATAYLTEDDERITKMELRGNSHMTGKPGVAGPQDMRANNIDLMYGDDGRTLQSARLVDGASVQLPGEKGRTGRRIAAKAMDIAMAPDGATVTNLVANESVQVDLPPDGDTPARRIRSASLMATGTAGAGITAATFGGGVELRETRAARGKLAAIDRTSRCDRMDVKTKPGFGDLENAMFHGNARLTDGPKTTAEAPSIVYNIAQDRLELSPGEAGEKGLGPHVSDGRISVEARAIQMGLTNQKMKADTRVRSVMTPQSGKGAKPEDTVKVPSMLKQDEPVNIMSNRLDYDGASSVAIYDGNARLWQGDTEIKADKMMLDDKTGNLRATTNVISVMALTQADAKKTAGGNAAAAKPAAPKTPAETTTTTADELLYEDAKHRATYTGHAHSNGPSGDVTADKIELFLAEQGGQLERAEADGNVVSRQDNRRAYGRHLTYMARDELYTMTGSPVKIFEQTPTNCRITEGTTLVFDRTLSTTTATGSNTSGQKTRTEPSCPAEGSF
jgi:lipopolysaccharide export system protein LptA